MTGSSAATTAAVQGDDCDCGGFPLLALGVILAALAAAIYILTRDSDDNLDFGPIPPVPRSPA